ncbi:PadR family transcriptional regulator [Spiractinospora alimapuensis]|uniref:PadR family transcriptional regulator n=1 Tax=Spiractinospora alimapuensis TaxID=2820884 RepID=UPI001F31A4B1|nr:PadR family transcriptional regulator [Spiractinospora alimapuensis]QVQ53882.1 PadR family transcriptional regulator [Spiractinospora alimapuensis]
MAKRRAMSNLLGLALLSLLMPGHPMHPYQMAAALRRTGKWDDMGAKTGSLYTVVRNLERHGFIAASDSYREGRRPERTEYTITPAGLRELEDWLRDLVAHPDHPYSGFEAALSVLGALPPDQAVELLRERLRALEADVERRREALREHRAAVQRIFLIDAELTLAMREAESAWVRALVHDLDSGSLEGLDGWRALHASGTTSSQFTELLSEEGPTTT